MFSLALVKICEKLELLTKIKSDSIPLFGNGEGIYIKKGTLADTFDCFSF